MDFSVYFSLAAVFISGISLIWNIIIWRKQESFKAEINKEFENHKNELNKGLENHKANLDGIVYVTKTRFDTEFSIYRELSSSFHNLILCLSTAIQCFPYRNGDKTPYENLANAIRNAQLMCISNAPFIKKDFYVGYSIIELYVLECIEIISSSTRSNLGSLPNECDEFQSNALIKLGELNDKLRDYLSSLEIKT
ncbi:MAG: hypothetical protein FWG87_11840 [Defluviitaleaceae bacterium]|nr:hypothetical protein [Defluviitaleaceae bacterium]